MLDAFVLIFGNADFMEWVKIQYAVLVGKPILQENPVRGIEMVPKQHDSQQEEGSATNDELLEVSRLSSAKMGRSAPKQLSAIIGVSGSDSS